MAATITAGTIQRITMSATPNALTRLDLPSDVSSLEIRFFDAAGTAYAGGKVALTGTDAAAIGTEYLTLGEGELYELSLASATSRAAYPSIYLASATASAIVEVVAKGGR